MVKAFPLNQQEYSYNAQDVSYYYAGRHSGVFALDTNCQVSIVSGMNVKVAKGKGWLAHGVDYGVVFWMEEDVELTVPVGDVASPRWDYVCVGWETTEVKNNPTIYIKSGSPAVTPAEPTLENSANKIEICLAKIYVPSGTTNLTATGVTLTDTRADKAYCGLVGDDLRTTNLEERATDLEGRATNLEQRATSLEKRATNLENGTTLAGEASKAKKLSNQITINGTKFDGSSNITTQKWGIPRNFITQKGTILFDGSQDLNLKFLTFDKVSVTNKDNYLGSVDDYSIKCITAKMNADGLFYFYVEKKPNNMQFVITSSTAMTGSVNWNDCGMQIITKKTDSSVSTEYQMLKSFNISNSPSFVVLIIIDLPIGDL